MSKTLIFSGASLVLLGSLSYTLFLHKQDDIKNREVKQTEIALPATEHTKKDFVWKSETLPEKDSIPYEKISLEVAGIPYPVGIYSGCSLGNTEPKEADQITTLTCWFAGAGTELTVTRSASHYFVMERFIQETEDMTQAPAQGAWKKLLTID